MISDSFRDELMQIIQAGDEARARAFVIEHIKEFPQEVQDAVVSELVFEAMAERSSADEALAETTKKTMDALTVLQNAVQELDKAAKLADIKESL